MTDGATTAAAGEAVLVGAGDIADCGAGGVTGAAATAALLDQIPGTVFTLGDNVYPSGAVRDFERCYRPTWGRHLARTRPAPGNHDYVARGAAGYFAYFGMAAGSPGQAYYGYDAGAWHVVVLDSNCREAGGCGAGSAQERWLRADLAAHPSRCTLAYWHHPRFSSGKYGDSQEVVPFWRALYDAGADLVLAGHDHAYERFAPQDPMGLPDAARGLRQIVAGTGGKGHYPIRRRAPNSEVRDDTAFGVLKLTLRPEGYSWEFVPVRDAAGKGFSDSGSAACH